MPALMLQQLDGHRQAVAQVALAHDHPVFIWGIKPQQGALVAPMRAAFCPQHTGASSTFNCLLKHPQLRGPSLSFLRHGHVSGHGQE
ncbi:MAG: hypothetical protein CMN50_00020 [SAR116 cluster bacterium]|nr:hypothetical protein [SAR116 cluster bacterium]